MKSKFTYVTYIATTAEKAWRALTEGEITRQYWGHENQSDWKPGSPWKHVTADAEKKVRIVGEVVEVDPPKRLVITWASPEEAARKEISRVTFELMPVADMLKLTVTHDELEAGSSMDSGVREGWPRVLSSLKSFLETGRALDTWAMKKEAAKAN